MTIVLAVIPNEILLDGARFYCGAVLCKGNMSIRVVSKELTKIRDTNNVQWDIMIINTLGNLVDVVLIAVVG